MARNNIWIAAADGDEPAVLAFIAIDPSAVNSLDENGYTPLHAAASYSHDSLLRKLVLEHGGNANIQDFDGETPLFVTEKVEIARLLVEELHADPNHRNHANATAADVIEEDGEFPLVAAYLRSVESKSQDASEGSTSGSSAPSFSHPLPSGVSVSVASAEELGEGLPVDEEFRRRIEELAARGDFDSEQSQQALRDLVAEAVQNHVVGPDTLRSVRAKLEEE
ncbi:hypothetical protein DFH27DRAFT_242479 [Peziza echinospora]|nr:hypothetical protein DFH27DRAFT_242479 [Peziza echinospora]